VLWHKGLKDTAPLSGYKLSVCCKLSSLIIARSNDSYDGTDCQSEESRSSRGIVIVFDYCVEHWSLVAPPRNMHINSYHGNYYAFFPVDILPNEQRGKLLKDIVVLRR